MTLLGFSVADFLQIKFFINARYTNYNNGTESTRDTSTVELILKSIYLLAFFIGSVSYAQQNVKVYVTLFPAGDFVAATNDVTGSVEINSAMEINAKDIKVNLNSIKTGLELRDDHAKNKYLDVKKFPEAILVSATGKNGKGTGILRIKGKDAKVDGTYSLANNNTLLKAVFTTKLSNFDINDINYKGVGVEDDIKLEVAVPVVASAAGPAKVKAKTK